MVDDLGTGQDPNRCGLPSCIVAVGRWPEVGCQMERPRRPWTGSPSFEPNSQRLRYLPEPFYSDEYLIAPYRLHRLCSHQVGRSNPLYLCRWRQPEGLRYRPPTGRLAIAVISRLAITIHLVRGIEPTRRSRHE